MPLTTIQQTVWRTLWDTLPTARVTATISGSAVAAVCAGVEDAFRTTDEGALAGPDATLSYLAAAEPSPLAPGGDFLVTDSATGQTRAVRAAAVSRTGGVVYVKLEPRFA